MTLYFEVPPSVLNGFLLIHLTVSINIKRSGAGLFRGSHTYCIELVLNRRKMRPIELHDSKVETILRRVIRSDVETTVHHTKLFEYKKCRPFPRQTPLLP